MQEEKDPYSNYDRDDWEWEFLRRNKRYKLRYRAVQRAKERGWGFDGDEEFLFIAENWAADLCRQLSLCNPRRIDDPSDHEDFGLLPNPDLPRDRFTRSPVRRFRAVVMNSPTSDIFLLEDLFESGIPKEHKVKVDIDARYKLEDILDELRKALPSHLGKKKYHTNKFKSYLDVWDLRQKEKLDDAIASELWPEEHKKLAEKDFRLEQKNPLHQRVHDQAKAAQRLIDNSFPRKRDSSKSRNKPPS
jgi:Family of unknown function (DUF6499)